MFGFPGKAPDVPDSARNLGLQDLRQALYWTKDNIAQFGGDPEKITSKSSAVQMKIGTR